MAKKVTWNSCTGKVIDVVDDFEVIDCRSCGFKHIVPIPTVDQLEKQYRHEYYVKEKPLYVHRTKEDSDWWSLVYSWRYDFFEKHLPEGMRRILDVGSGPGLFLFHGKERGWQTCGIEPSVQAAKHSQSLGLHVVTDFLTEETARDLGKFDVIHLSLVLEHIPDPTRFLALIRSMINPGGIVCVVAPNDYNPFQLALRKARDYTHWWVSPPHHINYFDFKSLGRLFRKCGLSVLEKEATFPIDIFLLMGDRYVGNDAVGRACHGKRMQFEFGMRDAGGIDTLKKLYRSLARLGIGREVVLYGKAPVE